MSKITIKNQNLIDDTSVFSIIDRSIVNFTIPNNVTSIGDYAFYN